jgi:hypothetical protein
MTKSSDLDVRYVQAALRNFAERGHDVISEYPNLKLGKEYGDVIGTHLMLEHGSRLHGITTRLGRRGGPVAEISTFGNIMSSGTQPSLEREIQQLYPTIRGDGHSYGEGGTLFDEKGKITGYLSHDYPEYSRSGIYTPSEGWHGIGGNKSNSDDEVISRILKTPSVGIHHAEGQPSLVMNPEQVHNFFNHDEALQKLEPWAKPHSGIITVHSIDRENADKLERYLYSPVSEQLHRIH